MSHRLAPQFWGIFLILILAPPAGAEGPAQRETPAAANLKENLDILPGNCSSEFLEGSDAIVIGASSYVDI
jgi:hypothetical protein